MARWAAVVGGPGPASDLAATGARVVSQGARRPAEERAGAGFPPVLAERGDDGEAALGLLDGERPGRGAGSWMARGCVAVGEVTLWNRAELLAEVQAELGVEDPEDGAVLTALLARDGLAALEGVRGAFALCLRDEEGLLLVRDAVGERTLFWSTGPNGTLAASSSLRALGRLPYITRRPSLDAVRAFLTFAYVPGEDTLLEGVSELQPGRWLRARPSRPVAKGTWWEPREYAVPAPDAGRFRELLEASVLDRLPQGRPAAVLLSGGIDSSAVTALAARLHDRPVRTWAISFGDDLPSERGYAELVALHCGTEHRTLTVRGEDVAERLPEAMALLDDPVGDPLTVPNLLLDEAIASAGHDVLLNGEGGDPVLGGPKNLPMLINELQPLPGAASDREEARAAAYLRTYRKLGDDLDRLLTPQVKAELEGRPPLTRHVRPYLGETAPMDDLLHRLLHANLRTKGAHHILPKVERLTSSAGIEGRSPLFDQRLVEAAFSAPPEAKLSGTREKVILKDAVKDLLPDTVVERPKSGMRVPVQAWLDGPLQEAGRDLLLGPRARERGILRTEPLRAWLKREGSLWPRHGQRLWLCLSLELWLRSYCD